MPPVLLYQTSCVTTNSTQVQFLLKDFIMYMAGDLIHNHWGFFCLLLTCRIIFVLIYYSTITYEEVLCISVFVIKIILSEINTWTLFYFMFFFTGSSSYSAYNTLDITYRVMNIFLSKHYNPMGLPFGNLKIYDKLQEMFLSNNKVKFKG